MTGLSRLFLLLPAEGVKGTTTRSWHHCMKTPGDPQTCHSLTASFSATRVSLARARRRPAMVHPGVEFPEEVVARLLLCGHKELEQASAVADQ